MEKAIPIPEIYGSLVFNDKVMKDRLYCLGASYAQMSGSGSAMFGIFREAPSELQLAFPESITALMRI